MIYIFIGSPGAGKGTQAELLAERCGFFTLSTGEALRKHVRLGTEVGKAAKQVMDRGELVSDEILLNILKEELGAAQKDRVILDGYPRNLRQAETLGLGIFGHEIKGVLHLDLDQSLLVERLSGRLVCRECGATYHRDSNPPTKSGVCDKCQGEVYQRADDSAESVKKRLEVYQQATTPVLDFYKKQGKYLKVDGNGEIEEVFARVKKILDIPC